MYKRCMQPCFIVVMVVTVLTGMLFYPPLASAGPRMHAAPDFTLKDLNGASKTLSHFRDKVVVLFFWATWCGACHRQIPVLNELYKEYREKGVVILSVSLDIGKEERIKKFVKDHHIPYTVLLGNKRVAEKYGVRAIPATWLIGKGGVLYKRYLGPQPRKILEQDFKELLKNPPPKG